MYCSKCGNLLNAGVKFCSNCGNCVEVKNDNVKDGYMINETQLDSNQINTSEFNANAKKDEKYGLYSLICGICSIVFAGIIGIVLGVVSVVFRKKEQEKSSKGKIGKILGIVGIIISIFYLFGIFSLFKAIFDYGNSDIKSDYIEQDNLEDNIFEPGITKNYSSLGYMDYVMPECWTYDDALSAQQQYKSYAFRYKDGYSKADINAGSYIHDVDVDDVKNDIISTGWSIANEAKENINGIEWYKMTTKNYSLSGDSHSYYNIFYFTISKQKTNFYLFNFYVSNDLNLNELESFNESIKYILNNVTLNRYDQ